MGAISLSATLIVIVCLLAASASARQLLRGPEAADAPPGLWALSAYSHLCTRHTLPELGDEGSGLTYNADTDTFWAVSRDPVPSVHELSPAPALQHLRIVALDEVLLPDPEGVAWMGNGQIAVACETTGNIVVVDVAAAVQQEPPSKLLSAPHKVIINLDFIDHKDNDFLEGLAFDPETQTLLAAQERKPKQLLRIDPQDGSMKVALSLEKPQQMNTKGSTKKKQRHPADELLKDISGIVVGEEGSIFLLSQASQKIVQLNPEGRLLDSIDVDLPVPEGIAFSRGGQHLVVLSEAKNKKSPTTVAVYAAGPLECQ